MDISTLSTQEKLEILALADRLDEYNRYNHCETVFTDDGPNSRKLYKNHVQFMDKGAEYRTRVLMGGNQLGKTTLIGRELEMHLTGKYPEWWKGFRFNGPVKFWIISKDNKQMVEAAQRMMLGEVGDFGTGMIRKDDIKHVYSAPGVPGGVARALIKYQDSETKYSTVLFKSNEQKMSSFAGDTIDGFWADEEIDADKLGETRMRITARDGIEIHTFTPVDGFTDFVKSCLPNLQFPDEQWCKEHGTWVQQIVWEDCPHWTPEKIKREYARLLPHEREARSKGLPSISEGRIYDMPEDEITVSPFEIPQDWPKCYAMDVGWKVTAAVWGAYNKDNDTWYIYDEYYASRREPDVHASAIRRKCGWHMPGVIDPASNRTNEKDGSQLAEIYAELGLNLEFANNALVAGIANVYERLVTGRLKIFRNCTNLLQEYRLYKYDKNESGKPARLQADHALDCLRYLINTGEHVREEQPDLDDLEFNLRRPGFTFDEDGRDSITGY